jgi:hypothetical protein
MNRLISASAAFIARYKKMVLGAAGGTVLGYISLYVALNSDRAELTITGIGFEPFPLVANQRELLVITFKNTGKNYATIEAIATDRVKNRLHDSPSYDPAEITDYSAAGGEEFRVISNLGPQPLLFTQTQINSFNAPATPLKIIGFIKYTDQKYWILGGGVVQFCYVWDPTLTTDDKFGACSEKQYTARCNGWFCRVNVRPIHMVSDGVQVLTPITMLHRIPDPKHPIQQITIRPKK